MPIFKQHDSKLQQIKELIFDLETQMQKITEDNLEEVLGVKFVSSEFALNNFRIDTLAFDEEIKSFVIIEYKRDRSFSVVDQGFAYLSLMLNNKADFILEYNEKMKDSLKREDIDWSQSRVLFMANSFTPYQRNAINFKDLPIELWEVKKYSNDTILYNQLKAAESKESINTVTKNQTVQKVSKEVKKYTVDDLFKKDWGQGRELFNDFREKIFEINSNIIENIRKQYFAYQINKRNFVEIVPRMNNFILYLDIEKNEIKDPEKKVEDCSNVGHWGTGSSRFSVENQNDFEYALYLIKQVYDKFNK